MLGSALLHSSVYYDCGVLDPADVYRSSRGGCIEMNVRMRYLMMRDCSTFMVCMICSKINALECCGGALIHRSENCDCGVSDPERKIYTAACGAGYRDEC